jgi:hypothetical protein
MIGLIVDVVDGKKSDVLRSTGVKENRKVNQWGGGQMWKIWNR